MPPAPERALNGSSPLTRGKLQQILGTPIDGRLIPAHAGKTPDALPRVRSRTAHPRSRGENGTMPGSTRMVSGSSPLTRGKRAPLDPCRRRGRLIPAHAGKTPWPLSHPPLDRAHPRSRGENSRSTVMPRSLTGSSPLTRGKLRPGEPLVANRRLIPAHAGKTYCQDCQARSWPAHPRSRGENDKLRDALEALAGSSPLTRGKLRASFCLVTVCGLIPAHAGKTPPQCRGRD